jgi:SNF2 family DNA or RNA helicase
MIILHASFIRPHLLVWGETPPEQVTQRPRRGSKKLPSPFPFDPGHDRLSVAIGGLLGQERAPGDPLRATLHLPAVAGLPVPSSPLIAEQPRAPFTSELARYTVSAIALAATEAATLLTACLDVDGATTGLLIGSTLAFWARAFRLAARLVIRQRFLPGIAHEADGVHARWEPVISGEDVRRFATLAETMPGACRALTLDGDTVPETARDALLREFIGWMVDTLVRGAPAPEAPRTASMPSMQTAVARRGRPRRTTTAPDSFDSLHDQWVSALRSETGPMTGDPSDFAALGEAIQAWRRPLRAAIDSPFRLCIRLEEPEQSEGRRGTSANRWYVRYLLRPEGDPSLLVPAAEIWKPRSRAAAQLKRYGPDAREYLLAALGHASRLSTEIERSLRDTIPEGHRLDTSGAHRFLTETAWLLEQAGFVVLLPAWWTRKGTKTKLTARATVTAPKMRATAGLTLDTIVQVDWSIALGDRTLTPAELEALARLKAPLVSIRGEWVQVRSEEIEQAIRFWKKKEKRQWGVEEVVRLALGAQTLQAGLEVSGVDASGAIRTLLEQLEGKRPHDHVDVPDGFRGTLRPYQQRGYAWLEFMSGLGLGACLADDMGLGKTVQTLALLELDRAAGHGLPTLLVCPTSVTENWRREAARFTPDLPVMVHHGPGRLKGKRFAKEAAHHALVVTSYALLHRDAETLGAIEWSGVVLDEAQNIKNPGTHQARTARALRSGFRIALTGTPVENHVGDLWSIMEFLNPGFLGSETAFKRRFLLPIQIERDPEAIERLRRLTTPFILRRVKTDRTIIADLPEKQEMKVFCTLTREQASLYAAVVKDAEKELDLVEGIQRKGVVLATISKLKQVCNHPAQFLGDNSTIGDRSGKLARLAEMLEEVLAGGERALVFSQFAEMGSILQRYLRERFGVEVLFLHGGTSKKQRDAMVERFQNEEHGPSIFILSLKAGGTGLNLTAANHVFHFDRWWNPAVENQATDRAFRIGQHRNVQVHKFLCAGTLEEKIDELIERKQKVADSIVGSGEGWLAEMSTAELKKLFELREDAVND